MLPYGPKLLTQMDPLCDIHAILLRWLFATYTTLPWWVVSSSQHCEPYLHLMRNRTLISGHTAAQRMSG